MKKTDTSPREVYGDIIDLPYPRQLSRPRMSQYERAAQFAPFAALGELAGEQEDSAGEQEERTGEQEDLP